jgi:hypothetical protein
MKKFLRSKANFEILEGFLSELLMEDVTILEILESESNQEDVRDKFNRVDLKVTNQKKEILIIEVQYEREFDYLQRILFGTSKVITEHQKRSLTPKLPRLFQSISSTLIWGMERITFIMAPLRFEGCMSRIFCNSPKNSRTCTDGTSSMKFSLNTIWSK